MNSGIINILFLGGAKRVGMARLIKKAGINLGLEVRIFSYELDRCVPIACEATVVEGRKWNNPNIINHIDEIVDRYNISIIIPFVDGAVSVAADYANSHKGKVFVPTGDSRTAELMFDKIRAAEAFEKAGLPIPATYQGEEYKEELIAKPRHGSASKGIVIIDSADKLNAIHSIADQYIIQKYIAEREELTVDCYVSVADGKPLIISPRLRRQTSGGEVTDTETVDAPDAVDLSKRVIDACNLRGAVTIQLIRDLSDDGRLMVMEVNPRLGGGAVCTVNAGGDIPRLIICEATGSKAESLPVRPRVRICRYPGDVIFIDNKYVSSL